MALVEKTIKKFGKVNLQAAEEEARIGKEFGRIIIALEDEIKKKILQTFSKVKSYPDISSHTHFALLEGDIKKLINRVIKRPLKDSDKTQFSTDDASAIRRAVAMSVIAGSNHAGELSKFFVSSKDFDTIATQANQINQQELAKRLRLFADAFLINISNWVSTNINVPIQQNRDITLLQNDVSDYLSEGISPFRVDNHTPESQADSIGRNQTQLAFIGALALTATFASSDDPELLLFAKSMAIHDGKAWPDSIEAEYISADWIQYPEPYMSMTDFRRRPNDRCYDVIMSLDELLAEGITPLGDEEAQAKIAEVQAEYAKIATQKAEAKEARRQANLAPKTIKKLKKPPRAII